MGTELSAQELRALLHETIFRGRRAPSVHDLKPESSKTPTPCFRLGTGSFSKSKHVGSNERQDEDTADITWERVQLRLHDESDPSQTMLNLLLVKRRDVSPDARLPTICILHQTSKNCETDEMLDAKVRFARRGFLAVGLNSRYHGCRSGGAEGMERYLEALVEAWKRNHSNPIERKLYPFIYDTAADLRSVADYLLSRPDVQPSQLGITGVSLGGMHAWFAAAVDERWTAVAPMIGVQSFSYAVEQKCFQARVDSIKAVFDVAASDLRQDHVSSEVVRAVWNRICPGLLDLFDSEASLALLSPRPVFIANGELDPRCPIEGVKAAVSRARRAFHMLCRDGDRLELHVYEGVGHCVTDEMWSDCLAFFERVFRVNSARVAACHQDTVCDMRLISLPCVLSRTLMPSAGKATFGSKDIEARSMSLSDFLTKHPSTAYTTMVTVERRSALPLLQFHCERLLNGMRKLNQSVQPPQLSDVQLSLRDMVWRVAEGQESAGELMVTAMLVVQVDGTQLCCHFSAVEDPYKTISPVQVECRGDPRADPDVKNTNWYVQRKPLEALQKRDISETILIGTSADGSRVLLEGLVSNIFFVTKSLQVRTAPDHLVLPGSMRISVLAACDELGVTVVREAVKLSDVANCEAAFLTNARKPLIPIQTIYLPSTQGGSELQSCVVLPFGSKSATLIGTLRELVYKRVIKTAIRLPLREEPDFS